MNSTTILIGTWGLAAAVVGAYIWFVVWRMRNDKRKKAAAEVDAARLDAAVAAAARVAAKESPSPDTRAEPNSAPTTAAATPTLPRLAPSAPAPSAPAVPVAPVDDAPKSATVAAALTGISLPHDLTPLTMVIERPGVIDRVVFSTKSAPAEAVGTALSDELERLGYSVSPLDPQTIAAKRGDDHLILVIHPDGATATIGDQKAFASAPDLSVVVEVWIP